MGAWFWTTWWRGEWNCIRVMATLQCEHFYQLFLAPPQLCSSAQILHGPGDATHPVLLGTKMVKMNNTVNKVLTSLLHSLLDQKYFVHSSPMDAYSPCLQWEIQIVLLTWTNISQLCSFHETCWALCSRSWQLFLFPIFLHLASRDPPLFHLHSTNF